MTEAVTFPSDGLQLSGAVHLPEGLRPGERRPAIIMMHGFGANKNGGPEWVCRQFAAWGYVALRFDYRGCGESEGERGRIIPSEEIADALNAVSYMAARPEVDPDNRVDGQVDSFAGFGNSGREIKNHLGRAIAQLVVAQSFSVARCR